MEFAFDSQQRLTGMVPNEQTAAAQEFTYDGASRLQTAAMGGLEEKYVYAESSSRLERTEFRHGNVQTGRTDRTYDPKGRLGEITTRQQSSSKSLSSHAYSYNALNQRTQANLENGARWNFAYDDLGQVVEGKKRNAPGNLVPGRQFEYTFDTIGNRTETKTSGRTASYTANALNQYTERQVPGAIDVSGEADPVASVTVEGQPAVRQLEYFYKEVSVSNGSPVYEEIRTEAAKDGLTAEKIGFEYLPATPESYTYDEDGNRLSDGRFTYTWDANNRLIALESISGAPGLSKRKATYSYDPLGRRISKKVWEWDDLTSGYVVKEDLRFLYHGWNLVAEVNAEGDIARSHLWGLDLSGSIQGAGGVGGLLCTTSYGLETEQWFPAYDGNGNVMAMVNAATGEPQARFEYDPFGGEVRATGPALAHTKFRYSSKYLDVESDQLAYQLRTYEPLTGSWMNRDLIEEQGGLHLYGFVGNDPINQVDPVGLEDLYLYTEHQLRATDDPTFFYRVALAMAEQNQQWTSASGNHYVPGENSVEQIVAPFSQLPRLARQIKNITSLTIVGHPVDYQPDVFNLKSVDRLKFVKDAKIWLYGCTAGSGENPSGQRFADYFRLTTYAPPGGVSFGDNAYIAIFYPRAPLQETEKIFPALLPVTMKAFHPR